MIVLSLVAMTAIFYHATSLDFDVLDPSKTVDGGIHFGSLDQARSRGGPRARILAAELEVSRPRRSRDAGGKWAGKIRSAKATGHDAIVYLNRYEGIPVERVLHAQADGVDLDTLSDAAFRRRIPEARDSWIVFATAHVRRCPDHDVAPNPVRRRLKP